MTKVFTDVSVFMSAADQTVYKDNKEQAELYLKLIKEEYGEFLDAIRDSDDVETIDACFDMIWVIVGYMHSRGWDCEGLWDEGAQSNLKKINFATKKVMKREDGKVLKPEGWTPPNFKKFA
jgi:predicted HAD superfamily Cof-like phosphohydrolase